MKKSTVFKLIVWVILGHNLMLQTFEGDGKLPGIRIHPSKVESADVPDGLVTRNTQWEALEVVYNIALDRVLTFIKVFTVRCRNRRQSAGLTEIHTRYCEILRDFTGGQ